MSRFVWSERACALALVALVAPSVWSCGAGESGGTAGSTGSPAESGASSVVDAGLVVTGNPSGGSGSGGSSAVGSSGSSGVGTTGSSTGAASGSTTGGQDAAALDASVSPPASGTDGGAPESGGSPVSGGAVAFAADRVIVTGVRSTASPAAESVINLHNSGQTAATVTRFSFGGNSPSLFQVTTATPATIMPGADLAVTVEMATTGATLPPLPLGPAPYNLGSNMLTATLTASLGSGSAQANVYGLLLVQDNFEPTLGQINATLGYPLKVGQAQDDWNPNTSMMAANLPGIETGTDEVAAPLFVEASPSNPVSLQLVARFSPVGVLPYGWYPSTSATTRTVVGTMAMVTDPQTSNKARMVHPPLAAGSATTFDPGTAPFGLWIYSDQKTNLFNEGGNPANGDYDFSQDALNTPACHRMKVYPLKDSAGARVPQSYLVAVEEAGNGDYQDYVFVLGNVSVAP